MTRDDAAALRARLVELRDDAINQLAEALPIVDCGLMRLIADASAVLEVLDEAEADSARQQRDAVATEPR